LLFIKESIYLFTIKNRPISMDKSLAVKSRGRLSIPQFISIRMDPKTKMSDVEFFAKVTPKRLTSLAEDFKQSQEEFRKDEKDRGLRRAGNAPKPEVTRERLPCDVIHKQDLSTLLRSGQVLPASELAKQKEGALRLSKDLEEAVRSEISHRRTKIQTEPDETLVHYTREPFLG